MTELDFGVAGRIDFFSSFSAPVQYKESKASLSINFPLPSFELLSVCSARRAILITAMKPAFSLALLSVSLFSVVQAARSPVQLEALRRDVIEAQGARRAAAARAEEVAPTLHERTEEPEKRASKSTITFSNPAAAGMVDMIFFYQ